MSDTAHDPHFLVNFLIQDAIFYKSAFFKLLSGIYGPVVLSGYHIDSCESSLANDAGFVIFGPASPFFGTSIDHSLIWTESIASRIVLDREYIRLLGLVHLYHDAVKSKINLQPVQ